MAQTSKTFERAALLQQVRSKLAAGHCLTVACDTSGVTPAWYAKWSGRYDEAGLDGLADLPRSGRPGCVELAPADREALRRAYLKSNLKERAGSMTLAARWCAKSGQLSAGAAAAILAPRASKHALPAAVRRACRASGAEVARYRDAKAGLNDGIYVPGWLRMSADGSRRLRPNERWVGDDASVNTGVCVPWERGGDRCSDRFGVRVARFQLLALIDCATDMCVGYSYVMRSNDAYTAADVVSAFWRVAVLRGGMPAEMVCEGGAWQAARTRGYLAACGTELVDARGRPNQKLIEGWFNRLWSVLSLTLPAYGQIGRKRGEMAREKDLWTRCRRGAEDPRRHFPLLPDFLRALDGAVAYCNAEAVESREYGAWVPEEAYAERAAALRTLPAGIRRYALPVRERRVARRGGMAFVRAESPLGFAHNYAFAMRDGAAYDGAAVTVAFDPGDIRAGAMVELAADWRGERAGRVLDEAAPCVSPAPELVRSAGGVWRAGALDPRREAAAVKRASRALVGTRVAAFDARGVVAREDTAQAGGETARRYGFGEREPAAVPADSGYDNDVDFAALEAAAGVA